MTPGFRHIPLAAVVAALVVASCGPRKNEKFAFDGIYFKAKASAIDKKVSLADFTATVSKVSQSIDGALEAGRYEGTKYCINNYGTSRIDWAVGPETPRDRITIVDDEITFKGRCDP